MAIISENFLKLIDKDNIEKDRIYNYSLSNKIISIYIKNMPIELFSENNIILSNIKQNFKILFKIFYFQEKLNRNISLQIFPKPIPIGLIQKEWIRKLKNIYEFNMLVTLFKEKIQNFENMKEYDSSNDEIIEKIIENLPNEYIEKINEKEKENKYDLNTVLNREFIYSIKNNNNSNKKTLKYIKNFEIVGSDIILPLIKLYNNFSNNYLEGECLAGFNKIVIMFKDKNDNSYYEIGILFDDNSFQIYYSLDIDKKITCKELRHILYILDYKDFLGNIYSNIENHSFLLNSSYNCFCFSFIGQNNGIYENKLDIDNRNKIQNNNIDSFIEIIKKSIISIFNFETDFNIKLKNSKNKVNKNNNFSYYHSNCHIINKILIDQYKSLILYETLTKNLNNFINQNSKDSIEKIISNKILEIDKQYFLKIIQKETIANIFDKSLFLNLKSIKSKKNNDNKIVYPQNFVIINEEIYNNLIRFGDILNMNILKEKSKDISFYINNGKIILNSSKYNYLLIINKENTLLIPEIILYFYSVNQQSVFFSKFSSHKYEKIINDSLKEFI